VLSEIQVRSAERVQHDTGTTALVPKMDEMVRAHNIFKRKGTKPILQATVSGMSLNFEFKEEGLMSRLGRLKVSPKNRANDV